jgi:hypothetical protein
VQPDSLDRPPSTLPATVGAAVELALHSIADVATTGEEVEDEWQYVQDLMAAWSERLEGAGESRREEPLVEARAAAVVALTEEAARITDPHRAIDWLSTLPQAVLVALGERP